MDSMTSSHSFPAIFNYQESEIANVEDGMGDGEAEGDRATLFITLSHNIVSIGFKVVA